MVHFNNTMNRGVQQKPKIFFDNIGERVSKRTLVYVCNSADSEETNKH